MIKEHPIEDRIMIQIDNEKIELNEEYQKRVYEYLKKKFEGI